MSDLRPVLEFLRKLNGNNNREWFIAHKSDYLEAKAIFDGFALELASAIREFDDTIGDISLSDMTWRIYRDVRFSKDKGPYKCHMGVYVCRGGKKSGYSGYYFHISAADDDGWEKGHVAAVGNYFMEPKVVRILREDILYGEGDFRNILSGVSPRLVLETDGSLKKVPKDFPADSPDAEFFKLKNFGMSFNPDDDFVLQPGLVQSLAEIFRTAKPFLDYVNRAIEFSREQ